jgi:microcin C transport system substrate-binding protein
VRAIVYLFLLLLLPLAAWADSGPVVKSNALTVLGAPALPPNFSHFPYVNPNAPKGGSVNLATLGTFDSFNPFILRGTAAFGLVNPWIILPGGSGSGTTVGHVWESLLTGSADEGSTAYGHLAESIELPADKMWVAFNLRPEARFSDGTPVTAEDVAWTYRTLLAHGRPSMKIQFADVADVTVEGPRRVVFHFRSNQNRDLPLMVGGLSVLPKHFFENRDFERPLTDAPIGSGPYRVASFDLGRSITYQRDPNWWATNMPTGKGTNNFDQIRVAYFRDGTVSMEAFKAGQIDIRSENVSKNWATAYEFPAVKAGQVIKRSFSHHLPNGIQGYAMNTRRPVFADRRVRQAIATMFDFEWSNKALFFGAYTRTTSFFSNSDLASSGLPDAGELALLEPFKAKLPTEIFLTPFSVPVTDGSGNNREQMRQALALLKETGWTIKDRKLVDANGQQMSFTILLDEPSLERPTLPYTETLQKLGIDARVRMVDPAQYQRLTDDFDFDMTMMVYPQSDVPGNELRDYFSCAAAKAQGSANVSGVCDPAVDALVEKIVTAQTKPPLRDAARALDRVLLQSWYLVPNWGNLEFHVAWWDRFGWPDKPVREGFNFDSWWMEPAKAAASDAARGR